MEYDDEFTPAPDYERPHISQQESWEVLAPHLSIIRFPVQFLGIAQGEHINLHPHANPNVTCIPIYISPEQALTHIEQVVEHGGVRSTLRSQIWRMAYPTFHDEETPPPAFTFGRNVRYPDEICPQINAAFLSRVGVKGPVDVIDIVQCDLCPSVVWVIAPSADSYGVRIIQVSVEEFDRVEHEGKVHIKYEYVANVFGRVYPLGVVDDAGRFWVNRLLIAEQRREQDR